MGACPLKGYQTPALSSSCLACPTMYSRDDKPHHRLKAMGAPKCELEPSKIRQNKPFLFAMMMENQHSSQMPDLVISYSFLSVTLEAQDPL